jgi:hypothetical protein
MGLILLKHLLGIQLLQGNLLAYHLAYLLAFRLQLMGFQHIIFTLQD